MSENFTMDTLTVGKKKIAVKIMELNQADLRFYPENPRVYSTLNIDNVEPSQDEIEKHMKSLEHVRVLAEDIKNNGGLMEEIIVRDGDLVVLEGNSRLAAYRILCETDPVKWGKIKCKILPSDIKEEIIFKLIGQFHIKGKKPWDKYEQASYLYRRMHSTKLPIKAIAKELGLPLTESRYMVEAVTMMKDNNETDNHKYSYYYEFIKDTSLRKYRETSEDIDIIMVSQIQRGEIEEAQDVRKLAKVAKEGGKQSKKLMKEYINGEISLYEAYDEMESSGKLDNTVKKLKDFRRLINSDRFEKNIMSSPEVYKQASYEINQINKRIKQIMKKTEMK